MHAMKTYGGSRGIAPSILNLNSRCNQVVTVMTGCFSDWERTPSTYWVWGWVGPQSLSWCFGIRQPSFASGRNRTPDCPVHTLYWLVSRLLTSLCAKFGTNGNSPVSLPVHQLPAFCCSESTYCATIKMIKLLPWKLTSLKNEKAQFKVALRRYLNTLCQWVCDV
jgi:hypothetical protein